MGHDNQLVSFEAGDSLLTRGAAAKVLPTDQDAAGRNLLRFKLRIEGGLIRKGELRRLGGQHGGHVTTRINDVGRYVIADFEHNVRHRINSVLREKSNLAGLFLPRIGDYPGDG